MIAALILQATVTCSTVAGVTTCTDNRRPPLDYGAAMRDAYNSTPTYNQLQAQALANRERRAQLDRQQLSERVGALVAAGDCDAARKAALQGGDFDLAARVKSACE